MVGAWGTAVSNTARLHEGLSTMPLHLLCCTCMPSQAEGEFRLHITKTTHHAHGAQAVETTFLVPGLEDLDQALEQEVRLLWRNGMTGETKRRGEVAVEVPQNAKVACR